MSNRLRPILRIARYRVSRPLAFGIGMHGANGARIGRRNSPIPRRRRTPKEGAPRPRLWLGTVGRTVSVGCPSQPHPCNNTYSASPLEPQCTRGGPQGTRGWSPGYEGGVPRVLRVIPSAPGLGMIVGGRGPALGLCPNTDRGAPILTMPTRQPRGPPVARPHRGSETPPARWQAVPPPEDMDEQKSAHLRAQTIDGGGGARGLPA